MVFNCRCLSFSFQEEVVVDDDDEYLEYETTTQTNQTFYTASSNLSRPVPDSVLSYMAEEPSNLRVFTLAELKAATNNFCKDSIIGEGELGSIYQGVIRSLEDPFDDIQVAVKYGDGAFQGYQEWVTEVNILQMVEHPNIAKLVGYCLEDDESEIQQILVYENMPNRNVEYHLATRSEAPLSWTRRLKVAQDVARGLAYLHEDMDSQIIFRDLKSSKIILDDQWNAKLWDFGFARLGPEKGLPHVTTRVIGTLGYADPGYIATGHLSSKSDVWSYGAFLYELITGRLPFDRNRTIEERNLVEWVKPYVGSKRFQLIIDPRLEHNYSLKSAQHLSVIANRCLSGEPKSRPRMSEVLEMVNQLLIGVSSEATNLASPPPKSLVQSVAIKLKKVFMCTSKV